PLRAAVFGGDGAAARLKAAGRAHVASATGAEPVAGIAALTGQARDDLLDRPAGRELDDDEGDRHDAEKRRDHQKQPAQDIGTHQALLLVVEPSALANLRSLPSI